MHSGKPVRVSVVTPVLNGARFIRETIESVLGQQGDFDLEYIIRDGGSTDGTLDILKAYAGRCLLSSARDGSPQNAINLGMQQATGRICAWLNADDLFEPGALQAVVTAMAAHPRRSWCYGRCSIVDEDGHAIRKAITGYKNLLGWVYSRNILLTENFINQPATFWTRELWHEIGGIQGSQKACFDYELWLKMGARTAPVVIRRYLARFRRHATSISENWYEQQFREELAIAARYGRWPHVWLHYLTMRKITLIYGLLGWRAKRHNG